MKRILSHKGIQATNPRDVFRFAAQSGLINDAEPWFDFIRKRTLTIHTHNEDFANDMFNSLPTFHQELEKFIAKIVSQ